MNEIVQKLMIILVHENKTGERFSINLELDSAGTENIVGDMAELLYLGETGGFILEDELGKAYHSKLTDHYLNMIKAANTNPGQIYLVDKDEQGATVVKLLDDFVIREKDNIELGYLKGRYGAIPHMKR